MDRTPGEAARSPRYNISVLTSVAAFLDRDDLLPRSSRIGVAVSGGADSVCLLHVLRELAPERDLRLTVLHVNHQLRGAESDADAQFVAELAIGFDLPFLVHLAPIPSGENLEQAARDLRLDFFRSSIRDLSLACVATAHTRDDQAETVLFRFLRGSGAAGLAGIRPATSDGLIRPLLDISRNEVEAFLLERHIPWRTDSTNPTRDFARNRIRHDLLPQLERDWNPAIRDTLVRTADWARAEEEYWETETTRAALALFQDTADDNHAHHVATGAAVILSTARLRALPLALARRVTRRAMETVKGDLRSIGFAHVEAVLALTDSTEGHGRIQIPGLDIIRSFQWLRFGKLGDYSLADRNYSAPVALPGITDIKPVALSLVTELVEKTETGPVSRDVYNSGSSPDDGDRLDWDRLSGNLLLRNWRPGDQYRPQGASQVEKIKTLFQTARIPIWERRHWPVLVDAGEIVWSRRFGPAAQFAANEGSKKIAIVRESK